MNKIPPPCRDALKWLKAVVGLSETRRAMPARGAWSRLGR